MNFGEYNRTRVTPLPAVYNSRYTTGPLKWLKIVLIFKPNPNLTDIVISGGSKIMLTFLETLIKSKNLLHTMKEEVKKEILDGLKQARGIMERMDPAEFEELKKLSDHTIEEVAAQKDLDLIAVTVLLYSFYKVASTIKEADRKALIKELNGAIYSMENRQLGQYNSRIRNMFKLVKQSHSKVKEHLQDVMQAARIKKGTVLLEKGLSIGQAAGLMGLSNWDLQEYAGKSVSIHNHEELVEVKHRLKTAENIFNLKHG